MVVADKVLILENASQSNIFTMSPQAVNHPLTKFTGFDVRVPVSLCGSV